MSRSDHSTTNPATSTMPAHDAVRLLTAHGRPARRLVDGMLEWRLANLPVTT